MRKIVLSMSLLLAAYCGNGMAETPVFQLNEQQATAGSASAIYAYHPETEAANSAPAIVEMEATEPVVVAMPAVFAAQADRAWHAADVVPASFSVASKLGPVARKMAVGMNAADDLLFYFLKDFKARQPQKPARWAMLLIALSFLLYQVRRRPMRASIGFGAFGSTSRLAGRHAA